jgi:hypothetical protein
MASRALSSTAAQNGGAVLLHRRAQGITWHILLVAGGQWSVAVFGAAGAYRECPLVWSGSGPTREEALAAAMRFAWSRSGGLGNCGPKRRRAP